MPPNLQSRSPSSHFVFMPPRTCRGSDKRLLPQPPRYWWHPSRRSRPHPHFVRRHPRTSSMDAETTTPDARGILQTVADRLPNLVGVDLSSFHFDLAPTPELAISMNGRMQPIVPEPIFFEYCKHHLRVPDLTDWRVNSAYPGTAVSVNMRQRLMLTVSIHRTDRRKQIHPGTV